MPHISAFQPGQRQWHCCGHCDADSMPYISPGLLVTAALHCTHTRAQQFVHYRKTLNKSYRRLPTSTLMLQTRCRSCTASTSHSNSPATNTANNVVHLGACRTGPRATSAARRFYRIGVRARPVLGYDVRLSCAVLARAMLLCVLEQLKCGLSDVALGGSLCAALVALLRQAA